jgi:hypothetical protein
MFSFLLTQFDSSLVILELHFRSDLYRLTGSASQYWTYLQTGYVERLEVSSSNHPHLEAGDRTQPDDIHLWTCRS